jgi:hypothetical protein
MGWGKKRGARRWSNWGKMRLEVPFLDLSCWGVALRVHCTGGLLDLWRGRCN